MNNTYRLEVQFACPVHDGQIDIYDVTITSPVMIPVEEIMEFFAKYRKERIYQEVLAIGAATALGAHVKIVGTHSCVLVTSEAP